MTKKEFLETLRDELEKSRVRNIDDVLADYEEHFNHGISKKKSEEDIALSLGFPSTIAKAYKAEDLITEVRNPANSFQWGLALNIIGRLLLIAPFNFIVLFIPGLIIFTMMIVGWVVSLSLGASSMAFIAVLPILSLSTAKVWAWIAALSGALGLLGLGVLVGMIMFIISKYILLALINYLRWNIQFVTQK